MIIILNHLSQKFNLQVDHNQQYKQLKCDSYDQDIEITSKIIRETLLDNKTIN